MSGIRFSLALSFRLVIETKTGKERPRWSKLEFSEKFLVNNFALSGTEDNTSRSLNRGGIADVPLLRTLLAILQKSREPSFWEVIDSFFISVCKFGSFNNHFPMLISLSELYFRFRKFSQWRECHYRTNSGNK